ncbi:MAG: SLC13 family permease [Planctomycetota bacterium]|jgi:sodium-dependent dicarboxylate transporter 2/3/5
MKKPVTGMVVVAVVALLVLCRLLGVFGAWGMPGPSQVALALVILLIAAVLWVSEVIPLFVTSFVILALSVTWLRGTMTAEAMEAEAAEFMAPFFSDIILLFLGGFVLSAALHKYELDERLARRVIDHSGGSVPKLIFAVMCVTAFLSMWLSNTAATAMMLALCLPIVQALPAGDRYRTAILLAVPFAANVGGLGTPIGSPPNAIAIQYMGELGIAPSFLTWMMMGVPLVLVMLGIIWALLMVMYRGRAVAITLESAPATDRPVAARVVIAVALVTVAGWLTGAWHGQSAGTVALIPVLVLFGGRLLTVSDLRSLSWDVLLLMGGGLCLGHGIAVSGLAEWIVARVPAEAQSVTLLIIGFGVLACLMSLVMSNTAAANLLLPILVGLSVSPLPPVLVTVAFACSLAMALPISTPPNAIAFSSGELRAADMLKPGLILTAVGLVLTFTVGRSWWDVAGLF